MTLWKGIPTNIQDLPKSASKFWAFTLNVVIQRYVRHDSVYPVILPRDGSIWINKQ